MTFRKVLIGFYRVFIRGFLLSVFLLCPLMGQESLTLPGQLSISVDGNFTPFRGVVTIDMEGVTIECQKEIFKPVNLFDAPRSRKLVIPGREITDVMFSGQDLLINTSSVFQSRYLHLYRRVRLGYILVRFDDDVIVFELDDAKGFRKKGAQLLKVIMAKIARKFNRAAPRRSF